MAIDKFVSFRLKYCLILSEKLDIQDFCRYMAFGECKGVLDMDTFYYLRNFFCGKILSRIMEFVKKQPEQKLFLC